MTDSEFYPKLKHLQDEYDNCYNRFRKWIIQLKMKHLFNKWWSTCADNSKRRKS